MPTAHGDQITENPTTFRTVFSTGEIGEALANYVHYVLDGKKCIALFKDNGYGRPFVEGVKRVSERVGLAAELHAFTTAGQREEGARFAAAASESQPFFSA